MSARAFAASVLGLALLAGDALGAQWARVTQDKVEVYDMPTKNRRVIRRITRNSVVQASNYPTEGFYKVRLQDGGLGWISAGGLLLKGPPLGTDQPAKGKAQAEEADEEGVPAPPGEGAPSPGGDEMPPPLPDN